MALALHSAHRFFFVFAVGPSVLAPIFFIPSLFIDISSIIGPVQQAPGVISILIEPIFLGHIFGLPVALWLRARPIDQGPVF